jgi:short-subunit dehydrogenase
MENASKEESMKNFIIFGASRGLGDAFVKV